MAELYFIVFSWRVEPLILPPPPVRLFPHNFMIFDLKITSFDELWVVYSLQLQDSEKRKRKGDM